MSCIQRKHGTEAICAKCDWGGRQWVQDKANKWVDVVEFPDRCNHSNCIRRAAASCCGVVLRLKYHDSVEDVVSAATSIVVVYIALTPSLVLNVCYKGEQIFDVIANVHNIDTQVEFNTRGPRQSSHILEVGTTSTE